MLQSCFTLFYYVVAVGMVAVLVDVLVRNGYHRNGRNEKPRPAFVFFKVHLQVLASRLRIRLNDVFVEFSIFPNLLISPRFMSVFLSFFVLLQHSVPNLFRCPELIQPTSAPSSNYKMNTPSGRVGEFAPRKYAGASIKGEDGRRKKVRKSLREMRMHLSSCGFNRVEDK